MTKVQLADLVRIIRSRSRSLSMRDLGELTLSQLETLLVSFSPGEQCLIMEALDESTLSAVMTDYSYNPLDPKWEWRRSLITRCNEQLEALDRAARDSLGIPQKETSECTSEPEERSSDSLFG
jgi:hypothetical protein